MQFKNDNTKLWSYVNLFVKVAIGFMYLLLGGVIIQKEWFVTPLKPEMFWPLSILLILYGSFRIFRAFKAFMEKE